MPIPANDMCDYIDPSHYCLHPALQEEMRTISWLAVLCATVCCGSSLMLAVLRSKR